jgi:hypothetical protein
MILENMSECDRRFLLKNFRPKCKNFSFPYSFLHFSLGFPPPRINSFVEVSGTAGEERYTQPKQDVEYFVSLFCLPLQCQNYVTGQINYSVQLNKQFCKPK